MAEEEDPGIYYRDDIKAWWPRYDHKPEKCFEFVTHGMGAIDVANRWLRRRRACVQAGGHAGYWPKKLAGIFDHVYTFEPEAALFACLERNCQAQNVTAYQCGLGSNYGRVRFRSHVSAGSWRVDPEGDHEIELRPIDSLHLEHCDALFLDIEGYEVEALWGAVQTIKVCRPLILVELLPRSAALIEKHLLGLNYRQVARYGRDGIYVPK